MTASLAQALLDAHEAGDHAALVALYLQASEDAQDQTAKQFYLTHAYVFALESGHAQATDLKRRLVELGAEPDQN